VALLDTPLIFYTVRIAMTSVAPPMVLCLSDHDDICIAPLMAFIPFGLRDICSATDGFYAFRITVTSVAPLMVFMPFGSRDICSATDGVYAFRITVTSVAPLM
jgi:hypothetical protein